MSTHMRLKDLRTALGYSQIQFATVTGIQQANLSRIESGHRQFEKVLQEKIIKQFNVNPSWWASGEGKMIEEEVLKVPIYLWHNLEGAVIGFDSIRMFSDCTKLCDYTGPDFGPIKKGSLLGLRITNVLRCTAGDLLVITHKEGSFTGYFQSSTKSIVILNDANGNPFQVERPMIQSVYRVAGMAFRLI